MTDEKRLSDLSVKYVYNETVGSMLLAWSPMGQLGHFQALQNPQVRLAAPSRT